MSGHRQAAIALYGVDIADQEAILASLPAADQTILRQYLRELQSLGFEPTDSALAVASAELPLEKSLNGGSVNAQLCQMTAACMYEVLAHEPATLIAQFLAFDTWPWAADFLEMFTPSRRNLIVAAIDRQQLSAPKCQQYLLDEVLRQAKRVARSQLANSHAKHATHATLAKQATSGIGSMLAKLQQRIAAWTR